MESQKTMLDWKKRYSYRIFPPFFFQDHYQNAEKLEYHLAHEHDYQDYNLKRAFEAFKNNDHEHRPETYEEFLINEHDYTHLPSTPRHMLVDHDHVPVKEAIRKVPIYNDDPDSTLSHLAIHHGVSAETASRIYHLILDESALGTDLSLDHARGETKTNYIHRWLHIKRDGEWADDYLQGYIPHDHPEGLEPKQGVKKYPRVFGNDAENHLRLHHNYDDELYDDFFENLTRQGRNDEVEYYDHMTEDELKSTEAWEEHLDRLHEIDHKRYGDLTKLDKQSDGVFQIHLHHDARLSWRERYSIKTFPIPREDKNLDHMLFQHEADLYNLAFDFKEENGEYKGMKPDEIATELEFLNYIDYRHKLEHIHSQEYLKHEHA